MCGRYYGQTVWQNEGKSSNWNIKKKKKGHLFQQTSSGKSFLSFSMYRCILNASRAVDEYEAAH